MNIALAKPVLVTAPTGEPLSVQEAKDHMRIVTNDDPRIIGNLIIAARQYVEKQTGRALVTQTWDFFLDEFPCVPRNHPRVCYTAKLLRIPKPPLQSVTTVKYYDTDGVQQTLASTEYIVDNKGDMPSEIVEAYSKSWPATRMQANAVEVRAVVGYGNASAVPQDLKQAMLNLIAEWYENREASITGTINTPLSYQLEALLAPYLVEFF